MLQAFSQNLSNKLIYGGVLALLLFPFSQSYSQSEIPGFLERYNELLQGQEKVFAKLDAQADKNSFSIDMVESYNDIYLNHTFLNLLILNTPMQYHQFFKNDGCTVFDILLTDLPELSLKQKETIYFDYKDKKGVVRTDSLPIKRFYKEIVSQKCPGVMKISQNFDLKNIKTTLKKIKMKFPDNRPACTGFVKEFRTQVTSPYLCHLVENIDKLPRWKTELNDIRNDKKINLKRKLRRFVNRAEVYKSAINQEMLGKLKVVCNNLGSTRLACRELFLDNYWAHLVKNKPSSEILTSFCQGEPNLPTCLRKLDKDPHFCSLQLRKNFPSLTPVFTCGELQKLIRNSRLKMDYTDCPGLVGNETLLTFSRILKHFDLYDNPTGSSCAVNGVDATASFLKEVNELDDWDIKICYDDKIKAKEVCYPVMFGNSKGTDYSLSEVIGKIAKRLRGYDYEDVPCEITDRKDYRPALLKYKNGCFILKDKNFCTATKCDLEVIITERKFDKFTIKSNLKLNLFPYNYINESTSLIKLLEKNKKVAVRKVANITSYKAIANAHEKAIFVGVGCAESLLPSVYKRTHLNQCQPMPFIVDDLIEAKGKFTMQARTALDHIHAPRLIPWNHIFNSVKEYQLLHPINLWSFHALYK